MSVEYETRCDRVDWNGLLADVTERLRYLRVAWKASEEQAAAPFHQKMVEDLYLPAIRKLGEFCASVEVNDEGTDVVAAGKTDS
jgi:hypothetical protein